LKWKKWTDEEKNQTLHFYFYTCDFNRSLNMGIYAESA
jgi:hypothetical protein